VVLNAATSTVGQAVIQICRTLQLRTVAVVDGHGSLEKTDLWLKSLGATVVLEDKGSLKVRNCSPTPPLSEAESVELGYSHHSLSLLQCDTTGCICSRQIFNIGQPLGFLQGVFNTFARGKGGEVAAEPPPPFVAELRMPAQRSESKWELLEKNHDCLLCRVI